MLHMLHNSWVKEFKVNIALKLGKYMREENGGGNANTGQVYFQAYFHYVLIQLLSLDIY